MTIEQNNGATWRVLAHDDSELQDLPVTATDAALLTLGFSGRPWRLCCSADETEPPLLIIQHETLVRHVDTTMHPHYWNMLRDDLPKFKQRVAKPIIDALDNACFPQRQERMLDAARSLRVRDAA